MMKAGILEEMVEDTMEGLEGEEEEDAAQVENPTFRFLSNAKNSGPSYEFTFYCLNFFCKWSNHVILYGNSGHVAHVFSVINIVS